MYGRHLAGYGDIEAADDVRPSTDYARNELEVLNDLDDSAGAGTFNPPGTKPNIYADAGIFAHNRALPGYVKRDQMYQDSEVKSVNTSRPVRYVNAGAVAMDDRAKIAFLENRWFSPPPGVLNWQDTHPVEDASTVNVRQHPVPISGLGALPPVVNFALAAGALGLAAGLVYGLVRGK